MFVDFPKIITELVATPISMPNPTTTVSGFNFLKVFISEKGKDNRIVTFTDPNAFLKEYFGTSKIIYKKHGQHPYDILNILEKGGTVHCLRVCPSTSTLEGEDATMLPFSGVTGSAVAIELDTRVADVSDADNPPAQLFSDITVPRFILSVENPRNLYLAKPGNTIKIRDAESDLEPYMKGETDVEFTLLTKFQKSGERYRATGTLSTFSVFTDLVETASDYTKIGGTTSADLELSISNLLPATLSNSMLNIAAAASAGDTVLGLSAISATNIESTSDMEALLKEAEEDSEFFTISDGDISPYDSSFSILGITANGRGDFYNKLGFDISNPIAENLEKYPFFTYNFSPYQLDNNGNKVYTGESFMFSFYPDALDMNGNSLFIGVVLEKFLEDHPVYYSEIALENLLDFIKVTVSDRDNILNLGNIDFISGYNCVDGDLMYSAALATLQRKITHTDTTLVLATAGYTMAPLTEVESSYSMNLDNGSLGSLSPAVYDSTFQGIVNSLYEKAFNGEVTTDIFDAKQFPIDVVLDGNYSNDVKLSMRNLPNNASRKTSTVVLDATTSKTTALQVKEYFNTTLGGFNDHRVALYGQSMLIPDRFGRKDIRVTSPYFLVGVLMRNFKHTEGLGRALAGKIFGKIEGYKPRTLDYNPTTPEILRQLFQNKINYIVEDFDGARFMSQSTSQKKEDALSDLPNVLLVNRLIRIMQSDAEDFQFSRNKPEKVAEFQQLLTDHCNDFQIENSYAISGITVEVKQSEYDKIQKIARVNISVTFHGFIYSIVLSFTVA